MSDAPLSDLTELLARDDLAGAALVLERTPWANLSNALRTLPQADRLTAYRILGDDVAAVVLDGLTDPERPEMFAARAREGPGRPAHDQPEPGRTDA